MFLLLSSCAQPVRVSERKDKQALSACLPAAPVMDVDSNTRRAKGQLLTHERQTPLLALYCLIDKVFELIPTAVLFWAF